MKLTTEPAALAGALRFAARALTAWAAYPDPGRPENHRRK